MKKTKLGDLIKLMLLEQVADRGRGGRIVEEIQLTGFSEDEIKELEESINRDYPSGITIGDSKRIKITFGFKWKWPPWETKLVITISW